MKKSKENNYQITDNKNYVRLYFGKHKIHHTLDFEE